VNVLPKSSFVHSFARLIRSQLLSRAIVHPPIIYVPFASHFLLYTPLLVLHSFFYLFLPAVTTGYRSRPNGLIPSNNITYRPI